MSQNKPRNPGQPTKPDRDIRSEILTRLWREDTIHAVDLRHLKVNVEDGEVMVSGHVAKSSHRRLISQIAAGVSGVEAVHNQLVADRELKVQVAQALAADERTRPFMLRVGAFHGWIQLAGEVPSFEAQAAAEEICARVPDVRGVLALPRIAVGENTHIRRRLQPIIGASAHACDGRAGTVTQVVVDPHSRIVSWIAVSCQFLLDGHIVEGEYLVPAESIENAGESGVLLGETLRTLVQYPSFDPDEFPPAPRSWKPPFPYIAGQIRWSRELRDISTVDMPLPVEVTHEHEGTVAR